MVFLNANFQKSDALDFWEETLLKLITQRLNHESYLLRKAAHILAFR